MINPKIFKAYDIRGIYGKDFDESNFSLIIKGIYSLFVKKTHNSSLKISLGRDMRRSGEELYEIAKKTLVDLGCEVYSIGLSSTPTGYFSMFNLQTDAHIQITASHNPKEWNGIKFLYRDRDKAMKISKDTGMEDVKKMVSEQKFEQPSTKKGRLIKVDDQLKKEVAMALRKIKPSKTRLLKIVADPANGMGVVYLKELFKQYPVKFSAINDKLDGSFPSHQSDPLKFELYKELQAEVVRQKADFGLAPDGDGDRIYFIDEKGQFIPATMITALITQELLSDNPGRKIVADIRYTENVRAICKKLGGQLVISRIGHALITQLVNDEEAIFAGESSGHFYFRDQGGAESAVKTILIVIKLIQKLNKPLSEIVKSFHTYYESGEFNYVLPDNVNVKEFLNKIIAFLPQGEISYLDGVSISYPDWRCNIRTSNTEPLLRLNLESNKEQLTQDKLKLLNKLIISLGARTKD